MYQHFTILFSKALVDLAPKYILEQFMEAELMVNITEHEVSNIIFPSLWNKKTNTKFDDNFGENLRELGSLELYQYTFE